MKHYKNVWIEGINSDTLLTGRYIGEVMHCNYGTVNGIDDFTMMQWSVMKRSSKELVGIGKSQSASIARELVEHTIKLLMET